jgi:hypothetical protein
MPQRRSKEAAAKVRTLLREAGETLNQKPASATTNDTKKGSERLTMSERGFL